MPEEPKKSLVGDLAGLSEPLKKLVEVVSSGVGRFTDAMWFTKRDADNEAYKILKVGGAQTQVVVDRMKAVGAIASGSNPQVQRLTLTGNEVSAELSDGQQAILALKERSDSRAEYQNLLHQLNIEQTVNFAAEELAQEGTKVSEEPVDDDWKARYFNIIQDISNEEMQALWGKVLAGEVKKPKTFSIRTLDVLRNLSQREARVFANACKYLLVSRAGKSKRNYHFCRNPSNEIYEGVDYEQVLELMDCGLLQPSFTSALALRGKGMIAVKWQVADKYLSISVNNVNQEEFEIKTYVLSVAGAEISSLIYAETPLSYLQSIADYYRGEGKEVNYAKFDSWSELNLPVYSGVLMQLPLMESL